MRLNKLLISLSLIAMILLIGISIGCNTARIAIADLKITPDKIATGQSATIEASVSNTGKSAGKYTAVLKINGSQVNSQDVLLAAGEKKTISFNYSASTPGQCQIDLNGLSGALSVVNPPVFQITSMDINPTNIAPGGSVTVNAEIQNSGDIDGVYSAKLTVDGKEESTQDVTVGVNAVQKVDFTVTLNSAGSHTIQIGDTSKTITVLKPAEPI